MRVATWNIGGGFISKAKESKFTLEEIEYFINELKKINPDIVCFQEIHISTKNDQPKRIAKELNFNFVKTEVIADSHLKEKENLAISIISKYTIISSKFNKLPNPKLQAIWNGKKVISHDKGFLEVKIKYKDTPIRVLSGHMVPFDKFERDFLENDFKKIREEIQKIIIQRKIPTIICADMNFEDINALIPKIFKLRFSSILENYPTEPKGKMYDKLIISKEWTYSNSKIIKGKADHYLCFADVELRKNN